MPDNEYDIHGGQAVLDTIQWALGDVRACACQECWDQREMWRWVRMLVGAIERAQPGATPREIADALWGFLGRPTRRPLRPRSPERARWQAAHHLREHAAHEGWNLGQLYEIVIRGVARNR